MIYFLLFILLMGMFFSTLLFRAYRHKKLLNKTLENLNEKITVNQAELELKNEQAVLHHEELEAKNEQLSFQNAQINSSIEYAQKIQNSILPMPTLLNKFIDYFIIYKPKDVVSGDFYWFYHLPSDGITPEKVFIGIVDCTGHGVPGAFMSMIGNRLLNEIVIQKRIYKLDKILSQLNLGVWSALNQDQTKNNDGMDVALVSFEKNSDNKIKLSFSGAKRPVMIYKSDSKDVEVIEGDKRAIGGMQAHNSSVPFTVKTSILGADDVVYIGSDGYIDQPNNERKRFGTPKLIELIKTVGHLPVAEQGGVFNNEMIEYKEDTPFRDDITFLGFKPILNHIAFTSFRALNLKEKVILVVEDEDINFYQINELLKSSGALILRANHGEEAVGMCQNTDKIDLIFMDIRMPVMNGYDATKAIKANYPHIPIIAQTAYVEPEEKRKCFEAGCDDYITKPLMVKEVLATISKYLLEG